MLSDRALARIQPAVRWGTEWREVLGDKFRNMYNMFSSAPTESHFLDKGVRPAHGPPSPAPTAGNSDCLCGGKRCNDAPSACPLALWTFSRLQALATFASALRQVSERIRGSDAGGVRPGRGPAGVQVPDLAVGDVPEGPPRELPAGGQAVPPGRAEQGAAHQSSDTFERHIDTLLSS